jgi:leader peptidase (prepilin peptidase)/N-methyltransferase
VEEYQLILLAAAICGAAVGATSAAVTRRLLTYRTQWLVSWPVLAALTAALFTVLAYRLGLHTDLAAYGVLAAVSVPLAAIDIIEHRLPSALINPAYPALTALFGLAALIEHDGAPMLRALLGMLTLLAMFIALALASRCGIGAGDVRLAGILGLALAWKSWQTLVAGAVLGLLCGATIGATLILTGKAHQHTPIPLGPALFVGTFTALLGPMT